MNKFRSKGLHDCTMVNNTDMEDILIPKVQSKAIMDLQDIRSNGIAPKNCEFDQSMINFKNCVENQLKIEKESHHKVNSECGFLRD